MNKIKHIKQGSTNFDTHADILGEHALNTSLKSKLNFNETWTDRFADEIKKDLERN